MICGTQIGDSNNHAKDILDDKFRKDEFFSKIKGVTMVPGRQENVAKLKARGITFVGPGYGRLASGGMGQGRLVEVEKIMGTISEVLGRKGDLAGKRIVVTAGGTREAIDPVRFIGNRSSGKMGYAVAEAARDIPVAGRSDVLVDVAPLLARVDDWRIYLAAGLSAEEAALLRRHEHTGRPLGGSAFLRRLEHRLGRVLRKKTPGRKPKNKQK
jgi:hypothetical protein